MSDPTTAAAPAAIKTYHGWREVPYGLVTKTQLSQLEFPRTPGRVVAEVSTTDYNGKLTTLDLYRLADSDPTQTSAARLRELATSAPKVRTCQDCGAHTEHPLDPARPLCRTCVYILRLRRNQADCAERRALGAAEVADWLDQDGVAVVEVKTTTPPRTPSGKIRPTTAARIRAVDVATEKRILDVHMRLVPARSKFIPDGAGDPETIIPQIHDALLGRPLLAWSEVELVNLRSEAPHDQWRTYSAKRDMRSVQLISTWWRGDVDPYDPPMAGVSARMATYPGTPERLLLHLQRIGATATTGVDEVVA